MLQSTRKSLRDLVSDCVMLGLLALAAFVALSLPGCVPQDPPKLFMGNRTDKNTGRVVDLDHESIPDLVVLRVRILEEPISEVGAIASVSEGLELNDEVQLHWTEIFNTTNAPYYINHFRHATKVRVQKPGPSN